MRLPVSVIINPVVGRSYRMLATDEAFMVHVVVPDGLITVTSQSTLIPAHLTHAQFYRWFGDASGF